MKRLWLRISLLIIIAFSLTYVYTAESIPAMADISSQPVRQLSTVTASAGQTFQITVTFTAPSDDINSIGLSDMAPTGWNMTADLESCTPKTDYSKIVSNKIEYAWLTSIFKKGDVFKAVYNVTVPTGTAPGNYNFANGTLEYYVARNGPMIDNIATQSTVTISATSNGSGGGGGGGSGSGAGATKTPTIPTATSISAPTATMPTTPSATNSTPVPALTIPPTGAAAEVSSVPAITPKPQSESTEYITNPLPTTSSPEQGRSQNSSLNWGLISAIVGMLVVSVTIITVFRKNRTHKV